VGKSNREVVALAVPRSLAYVGSRSNRPFHDCADAWRALWERVSDFLNQFENGSFELLQYVGLLPKD